MFGFSPLIKKKDWTVYNELAHECRMWANHGGQPINNNQILASHFGYEPKVHCCFWDAHHLTSCLQEHSHFHIIMPKLHPKNDIQIILMLLLLFLPNICHGY
jgi:hypothetical protein